MNRLLSILAATLVGATASFFLVKSSYSSRQQSADLLTKDEQLAELRNQLRSTKAQTRRVETIEIHRETRAVEPIEKPNADKHIESLKLLDPKDSRVRRKAIYHLEAIAETGTESLPGVVRFFEAGLDLNFNPPPAPEPDPRNEEERRRAQWRNRNRGNLPSLPILNRAFPSTLRLGLIEATANIAGEPAERILLDILDTTARGIEVAYLEAALEKLEAGKHVESILRVAREILGNPPEKEPDAVLSLVDRRSMGYLYAILVKHKDLDFIKTAKNLLVTPEGTIDPYTLNYLRLVLGEKAMPILLAAYTNGRITADNDKIILRDAALRFIGSNSQANQIFFETVKEGLAKMKGGDMFDMKKYEHVSQPLGALMRDVDDQPVEVIANRRALLNNVRKQSSDIFLQFGFNMMDKRLGDVQKRKQPVEKTP